MPGYTQTDRPLRITTPLGPDALFLSAVHGVEGLSQLYRWELTLLAPLGPPLPFEQLMGAKTTVAVDLPGEQTRYCTGILSRFRQVRRDNEFTHCTAELVPNLWLLTQSHQSRIFQQMTVPDILKVVLAALRPAVRFELTGKYLPRDYCVQYRETDFAFASRLMEEEGIAYYFDQTADDATLILSDAATGPDLPGLFGVLRYQEGTGGTHNYPRVLSWAKEQRIAPASFAVRDYHFEVPTQTLDASAPLMATAQAGTVTHTLAPAPTAGLEWYDYPGGYAKPIDGVAPTGGDRSGDLQQLFSANDREARLRAEIAAASALVIDGEGTCGQLLPGYQFTLVGHFDGDGGYRVTRVEHEATYPGSYRAGDSADALNYQCKFSVLPAGLPFRPARTTPRPTIPGPQTATVVGPAGQAVFVDKFGRVKVQFHWDRQGKNDATSSCWVRVSQVWAGDRWGAFFWPRVGHEVVVAFEDGDPDLPLIVGSVYNGKNLPPTPLPANVTAGGIKSCTLGGDPGSEFNCVVFHDDPGMEYLQMHSQTQELHSGEGGRYHRTPAPSVAFSGSLPGGVGSGSGGGLIMALADALGAGLSHFGGKTGLEDWLATKFPGLYMGVFGDGITAIMVGGQYCHTIWGPYVQVQLDPMAALFAQIPGVVGTILQVGQGLGGNTMWTVGPDVTQTYGGPEIGITRGPSYEYNADGFSATDPLAKTVDLAAKAMAVVTALAMSVGDICAQVLGQPATQTVDVDDSSGNATGMSVDETTGWTAPTWTTLLATGISGRLHEILVLLEKSLAIGQSADKTTKEGISLIEQVASLEELMLTLEPVQLAANLANSTSADDYLKFAKARLQKVLADVALMAAVAKGAAEAAQTAANRTSLTHADTQFDISAANVTVTSQTSDESASVLHLTAPGGGNTSATRNGTVIVDATGLVSLSCGGANIGIRNTAVTGIGSVGIIVPTGGNISFAQSCPAVWPTLSLSDSGLYARAGEVIIGPSLTINETEIKLAVGEPGVGASITLSPFGIVLTYGEWSLTIAEEGIVASVAENEWSLTPAGEEHEALTWTRVVDSNASNEAALEENEVDGIQSEVISLLETE